MLCVAVRQVEVDSDFYRALPEEVDAFLRESSSTGALAEQNRLRLLSESSSFGKTVTLGSGKSFGEEVALGLSDTYRTTVEAITPCRLQVSVCRTVVVAPPRVGGFARRPSVVAPRVGCFAPPDCRRRRCRRGRGRHRRPPPPPPPVANHKRIDSCARPARVLLAVRPPPPHPSPPPLLRARGRGSSSSGASFSWCSRGCRAASMR